MVIALFGFALFPVTSAAQAPSGRGGYLLPTGYLSTKGSQIVDSKGEPVRIASIGWPGTDGPAGSALQGLWATGYKTILGSIKQDGFNTVRVAWSNVSWPVQPANTPKLGTVDWSKNPDLKGLTTLQIFQKVVDYAWQIGLKIIFDHHTNDGGGGQQPNGLWIDKGPGTDGTDGAGHVGTVDAAKFKQDWLIFAKTFAGNSTVIGFDIDNEPTSVGNINWGQGGPTDILAMYQDVGNAIQALNPDVLIIMEPPQEYKAPEASLGMDPNVSAPEGDLTAVENKPLVLSVPNKVVYSVHEYPTEITDWPTDSGPGYITQMNKTWGYLVTRNIAPVWIGEMGSSMTSANSKAWAATLLPYMNGQCADQGGPRFTANQQPVGGSWWVVGMQPDEPDGIQTAWGLGNYRPEQQVITDQLLFRLATGKADHTH
jgi:aryl-phospho-beta-D-glucosidase BglC (GH1 family)